MLQSLSVPAKVALRVRGQRTKLSTVLKEGREYLAAETFRSNGLASTHPQCKRNSELFSSGDSIDGHGALLPLFTFIYIEQTHSMAALWFLHYSFIGIRVRTKQRHK